MAPSHDPDDDEDHGGLVKKILETKKELEGGSQTSQAKQSRRTEIVRSFLVEKSTERQRREKRHNDVMQNSVVVTLCKNASQ